MNMMMMMMMMTCICLRKMLNVLRSCIQYALREVFEAYTNTDMAETNQELVANGCTNVCLTEGRMVKGVGQLTTGSKVLQFLYLLFDCHF